MTDKRVIESIDELGLNQPVINENYYLERSIVLRGRDLVGVDFRFEEVNGDDMGDPQLVSISFYPNCKFSFPCNMKMSDSYIELEKKLGEKAIYRNRFLKKNRIWVLRRPDENIINFSVNFLDEKLESIRGIVVSVSKPNDEDRWISI